MKVRLSLVVLLLFGCCLWSLDSGCNGNSTPYYVIPQDTMVMILKDIHIAQSGVDLTESDPTIRKEKYREFNQIILNRFSVPKERFMKSLKYYEGRPEVLDTLYAQVIEMISLELTTTQKKNAPKSSGPTAE